MYDQQMPRVSWNYPKKENFLNSVSYQKLNHIVTKDYGHFKFKCKSASKDSFFTEMWAKPYRSLITDMNKSERIKFVETYKYDFMT